ncbi:phage integrase family protein [Mycobacteroides abscessus subsp. abscessus]|uniref:tyrosine-type recombinase/integrase n=1 Tax=Mycobacteroides abscessus TaxID=36809 RepID=UPI000929EE90|nr:tyrosine-type recombinase/integrase [Mycobacteroides abscessus]MDM2174950.1 tyrosine-type recombinase/integrase [Mycobacteroides abscessus]MDM2180426.1 tyrosine-type recombinase/integrase [Mycobacteroides abscessus]MDM2208051.1 tyrosine-type recombinase/integrase [Mycobacteroides abscessus]MDM2214668.1 tyrosine-type recombinase/integrase [Mycobacteroides abscessus]MDM2219662.1 tyrosine-type recombinase/integrase [Mycobacteroides abscessus]
MRAAPVTVHGQPSWTLVDDDGVPVASAEQFLHWLRAVGRSPNTVRSYARHLTLFYRWLTARGIAWDSLVFSELCDFVGVLSLGLPPLQTARGGRSGATVKAVSAAVREFYEFHRVEGRGPVDLVLTRNPSRLPRRSHSFLAHVENRRPSEVSRLTRPGKQPAETVQVIDGEADFQQLLGSASCDRDRLLLSAMYDLGLRIGQALGLRHGDLDPMRRRVRICRREDNANGALSKQRAQFTVEAPRRFFDLYAAYLLGEAAELDSDYVFVNLTRQPVGEPMSYSNAYQLVERIAANAGIDAVHPHVLRHTHATALARAGWTAPEIAARLGQSHASSADVYIHLASDDLADRLRRTEHLVWRTPESEAGDVPR